MEVAAALGISVFGGVVSPTITAPIDRVKLLLQTQGENISTGRLSQPYKGVFNCIAQTYRSEGILSFWRGNVPYCLKVIPREGLNFFFKDALSKMVKTNTSNSVSMTVRIAQNLFVGTATGILTTFCVYPLDFARTRLAADVKVEAKNDVDRQFKGMIDVFRKIVAADGIVGLYRGFVISCVGAGLYRGLYFGLYDTFRSTIDYVPPGSLSFLYSFCLGFGTTLTAGVLVYPLDTIRQRMMMRSGEEVKYRGSIDCFRKIIKKEGFSALTKGLSVFLFKSMAGIPILVFYDSYSRNRRG